MATTISTQDLIDVKRDIEDIGEAVNEAKIVIPRYGDDFKSLPMIASEFQDAINTIVINDGVPAVAVSDASGVTQQEINTNQINLNAKVKSSVIYAAEYSLSESADNTTIYDQIIADAAYGAKIVFPYGKTLSGHFISENKSFNIDFNGCTLINTVDDKPIVQIGNLSATAYNVTETTLNHGDTQFTVVGASNLFKAGDIGYLWDGATRSTTGSVNYESVKIKSILGDVITVENFLASYKGASSIKFYHSAAQLKNPSLSNVNLKPTSTHNFIVSLIANSENPSVSNIETTGTTGPAVAIRYCYGLNANNIRPYNAANVASGQGYGLALLSVSKIRVVGVNGSGMRHMYDQDSAYFFYVRDISDDDAKNSPCMLAHNGFAGHGTCENVSAVFNSAAVYLSSQGYNGDVAALKRNHPFRKIHIKNINNLIPANSGLATSSASFGVYFLNSVVGCSVDGVNVEALGDDVLTQTSGSSLVRVNGVVQGGLSLSRLKANKVGRVFFGIGADSDGLNADGSQVVIQDVQVNECAYVYLVQGGFFVKADDITILSLPKSNTIGLAQVQSGVSPLGVSHGRNINYPLSGVIEFNCNSASAISGNLSGVSKMSANRLPLINGQEITLAQLQERSAMFLINPPTGVGNISVILPKPQTSSDTVSFSNPIGRNSVTFSGENMNADVTVDTGQIVKLMVVGSKWSLISRSSNT